MKDISTATVHQFDQLIAEVEGLMHGALDLEASLLEEIHAIQPDYRNSARNLLHYLSIRQRDIRKLQYELSVLGLSSLGRMEAHALATLEAVLKALYRLAERPMPQDTPVYQLPTDLATGPTLLSDHTRLLLGSPPSNRAVRIMVTMPSEAASDSALVRRLLNAGMDVMRINCAHDHPEAWAAMVDNLRQAVRELGRPCRILADLGGQKLRTGPLPPAGRFLKIKPKRDVRGEIALPGLVWVTSKENPEPVPGSANISVCVEEDVIKQSRVGDVFRFRDGRGKQRQLHIVKRTDRSCLTEIRKTAHFTEEVILELRQGDRFGAQGTLTNLPEVEEPLLLYPGSMLVVTKDFQPGRTAVVDENHRVIEPAAISSTLPDVFNQVRVGQRIWFDDGAIGGLIEGIHDQGLTVRITQARPTGSKLRADKGINLPDTELDLPALTPKDVADLEFMAPRIDMVGLSFLRKPEDVYLLEDHLQRLGVGHIGIVLKIENRMAFERLPRLLLAGLRSPPVGVMVARGDLAVEVGFERLAEVQEEILWMCEAAHVPVIWATQVLETLAKTGFPTRAEVTDAAMSGRAECVMMNKGPYIVEAVEVLNDILERMQEHQYKKSSMLRQLSISKLTRN